MGDTAEDTRKQENLIVASQCANSCPETKASSSLAAATLLPGPIANAVSFATRSTSLALRIGSVVGGYGFGAAQTATLSSLVIGRAILCGTLNRAGHDVLSGYPPDPARADAESTITRSLENVHRTLSQLVFWTAAGFHAAETTASTVSHTSQLFLSILDQFLGSTDSSRAIAGIIALIRRDFQNPATGVEGEKVGVTDLLLGLCGLAYLQHVCQHTIRDESRRLGYEETIWDVSFLDHEDCVETSLGDIDNASRTHSLRSPDADNVARTIAQLGLKLSSMRHNEEEVDSNDDRVLEVQLKKKMIESLPKDAKVSVSTSTMTTKTITVDFTSASSMPKASLFGIDVTESNEFEGRQGHATKYRVVYTVDQSKVRTNPEKNKRKPRSLKSGRDEQDMKRSITSNDIGAQKLHVSPPGPGKPVHSTTSSSKRRKYNPNRCPMSRSPSVSDDSTGSSIGSPTERHFKNSVTSSSTANQKRVRGPLNGTREPAQDPLDGARTLDLKTHKCPDTSLVKPAEKMSCMPKKGTPQCHETNPGDVAGTKPRLNVKPPWSISWNMSCRSPVCERAPNIALDRDTPRTPKQDSPKRFSFRAQTSPKDSIRHRDTCRSPTSPLCENRQNMSVPPTDTSPSPRSKCPTTFQENNTTAARNIIPQEKDHDDKFNPSSPEGICLQSVSQEYTLETSNSPVPQVVPPVNPRNVHRDPIDIGSLQKSGTTRGIFPYFHLVRNIARYSRFASAIYGHNFPNLMGILKDKSPTNIADRIHCDAHSFANRSNIPHSSILLSSFVDSQGGSDSSRATDTGKPLIHTVALDEESKAVVLTCRGTLGFEDVLADMMCEYDELDWQGKPYLVHKGIHASARRLLYGRDGSVLATIKTALERNPEYGLVLCGHSLGGSVTALLGILLAEPSTTGLGFVTSSHWKSPREGDAPGPPASIRLPPGRPIHVYAYGPAATVSQSLQKATRGLITSTVHGNDMVPYLSLGTLHDFQALALTFKSDSHAAKAEVKRRVWEGLRLGLAEKWYAGNREKRSTEDNEQWAYDVLKTLRASMVSSKLVPPGEVFKVDRMKGARRDTSASSETSGDDGSPASRVVLSYIRDVEAHFRQVRFGASMVTDHGPGRYEEALGRLASGVVGV